MIQNSRLRYWLHPPLKRPSTGTGFSASSTLFSAVLVLCTRAGTKNTSHMIKAGAPIAKDTPARSYPLRLAEELQPFTLLLCPPRLAGLREPNRLSA
jgi:hypothetical protein